MNFMIGLLYEDHGNYFFGLLILVLFLTSSSYFTQNQNMLHADYVFFTYLILLVYFYHLWLIKMHLQILIRSNNPHYFTMCYVRTTIRSVRSIIAFYREVSITFVISDLKKKVSGGLGEFFCLLIKCIYTFYFDQRKLIRIICVIP